MNPPTFLEAWMLIGELVVLLYSFSRGIDQAIDEAERMIAGNPELKGEKVTIGALFAVVMLSAVLWPALLLLS